MIIGIKNDYFVAMSITYQGNFEFPNKKFYYCLSNEFYFKEMPDLNDQHKELVNRDTSYFTGDPGKKLNVVGEGEENPEGAGGEEEPKEGEGGEGEESEDNRSEEPEIQVPPKDLTELDRLKYVTLAIENDCQIAPVGAFKMTAQHQVRRNEAFKGLDSTNSTNLDSYLHFRNVQTDEKKALLEEPSAPFNPNFLESISADEPKGCWNFQHDLSKKTVLGRSLMWPGYHFYHCHGKKKFGSVYIGDGLKNLEL